jgi:N-acetylmuramic acid 6-phosphate etherase
MNAEDSTLADVVAGQRAIIARCINAIAELLGGGGRLVYIGAGTSGRLGVLDAAECPSTFGTDPGRVVGVIAGGPDALTRPVAGAEDSESEGRKAVDDLRVGPLDAVVGVTASGHTPFVHAALGRAHEIGAWVGAVCCSPEHALDKVATEVVVLDVGPEILTGSTRLKAGTATKMVLNIISTAVMIRLGNVFDNWMVDLQPLSDKLRNRAHSILSVLTGLPDEATRNLLNCCGGEVKTAVFAHFKELSPGEARRRLATVRGRLRDALEGRGDVPAIDRDRAAEGEHPTRDPTELILGVDAGGSKTMALLQSVSSEPSATLGCGVAGSGNIADGFSVAAAAIGAAIEAARTDARCRQGPFAAACLAVAGSGTEEGRLALEGWARRRNLARRILVVTDAYPVLACAAPTGVGMALIAGTGSIAFGKNPEGETVRAGGWGWMTGEEGGGHGIAMAALRAVARSADGFGPETRLTGDFMELFRVRDIRSLLGVLARDGVLPARMARLAKWVIAAAETGDAIALQILDAAAAHLSAITATVAGRLGVKNGTCPLGLAGGILLHSTILRGMFECHLANRGVAVSHIVLVDRPAIGALHLARRLLG